MIVSYSLVARTNSAAAGRGAPVASSGTSSPELQGASSVAATVDFSCSRGSLRGFKGGCFEGCIELATESGAAGAGPRLSERLGPPALLLEGPRRFASRAEKS